MLEQVGVDLRAGVAGAHDEYALPREFVRGSIAPKRIRPAQSGGRTAAHVRRHRRRWERLPSPHAWSARRGPDEPMPIAWQTTDHLA
jgi:hypothetical protein